MGFLDMAKAFDSVSHEAIAVCLGRAPRTYVENVKALYEGVNTRLKVGSEESRNLLIMRGVRQGDPLSHLLFNCVIDELCKVLCGEIGVVIGKSRVNNLAFADDLVILSETRSGLVKQFDLLLNKCSDFGLSLNHKKCATLSIIVDGKRKKWAVSGEELLKVEGKK